MQLMLCMVIYSTYSTLYEELVEWDFGLEVVKVVWYLKLFIKF